jgi:glycosyltransferase involved in cell wall biosynthesis
MKIGAVLCARNEEHIIEEWVAHHLAIGIERIHIFDNMSSDATRSKIEHIHSVMPSVTVETWNPPSDVQRLAFNRGLEIMTSEGIDWCAFIDADEFIGNGSPAFSETFSDMLERHSTHCAIGLHWAIFGSSGHIRRPFGLIQESFLHRAEASFLPNKHIKSIVRPRYTMGAHHTHGFSLDHPYFTASGEEISWQLLDVAHNPVPAYAYTINDPDLSGWRVNHYFCQWRERWDAKVERSKLLGVEQTARTKNHWILHDRNEVFDPSALRWTPFDKEVMETISKVPPQTPERQCPATS